MHQLQSLLAKISSMGDVINFTRPVDISVSLEDNMTAQQMLELGILVVWEEIGGEDLYHELSAAEYGLALIQFADLCYTSMEEDLFKVYDDQSIGVAAELIESMKEAMNDLKREFSANDNKPDKSH